MGADKVLITRRVPPPAMEQLEEAGLTVNLIDQDDPPGREVLLEWVRGTAAMITMLSERIDAEVLDAAGPHLKVVANFAVGYDNIDLEACRERGIRVTNTPGVLTDATADLAWTLILSTARRVVEGDQLVRAGRWTGWAPLQLLGLQLSGATLGIVGVGRIGTAVGLRSAGFNMNVLYADDQRSTELEERVKAKHVKLNQLLHASDIVTLHAPLTPKTRHLVGRHELASMKSTALLINTARGPIVDESALVEALRQRRIAGAGFDVYENEPRLTSGLAELPNVVLLPHLGSATTATRQKMSQMVADNVIAVLENRDPPNPLA